MTLSQKLAAFAAGLQLEQIPPAVRASARDHVLDTLGVAVAAQARDEARPVRTLVHDWGGREQSTLIGERQRAPAASAALLNGSYAHALDFDDTHLPSIVHPSATLVPAVLAQAEAVGASGREALTALVAGYEVLVRLAMAQYVAKLRSSVLFERGFHATSIIGAVAAATACARMRRLDIEGVAHALAIACSMGSGLIEANRTGGTVKRIHCGWAAHCGIAASELAAAGLTGPPTVLEGRFGLFEAFCNGAWEPSEVESGLGERWETPTIAFKPYPCNHFTHAVVDAALRLRELGISPASVERVEIGTAAASLRTIGEPIELKRRPESPQHAKFSAPFVFATALAGGGGLGVWLDDFSEERLRDPIVLGLADRCDVVSDKECDRIFPHHFPAIVRVWTRDGETLEERVLSNRGSRERPLTKDELRDKLVLGAGPRAELLLERASQLEDDLPVFELLASIA